MVTKTLKAQIMEAHSAKWSMINNFTIQMSLGGKLLAAASVNSELFAVDKFNIVCKGMDLPQLSYSPVETYQGDQYKMTLGKQEAYRWNMSFRDRDQLIYWRSFCKLWQAEKFMYPEDIGITISVFKDPDYYKEGDLKVSEYRLCQIESVSNVQYSQDTEAQIAEFTVQMKSPKAIVY